MKGRAIQTEGTATEMECPTERTVIRTSEKEKTIMLTKTILGYNSDSNSDPNSGM
jgi:hypothetical protein